MTGAVLFVIAIGVGLAATLASRSLAVRMGIVDCPDGRRKTQTRPVALVGAGVLAAAILTLVGGAVFVPDIRADLLASPGRAVALLVAVVGIATVGLIDDVVNLRARYKLAGQLSAVLILVYLGGYRIDHISVLGMAVPLGYMAVPATAFWFLAAVNALNLLDGMDGLLGTVGVIVSGSLAWMAFAAGHPFAGYVAISMAGVLVGFLRFNLPPASVYLGDCGSMVIGLTIGALAIDASLKGPAVAIVAPAALLVLPILDTTAALVRRQLTGRGLAAPDRGHLHHEMLRRGLTRGRVLVLVAGLGAVAAGGSLAGTFLHNDLFALCSAGAVVMVLIATGLFGTAELRLIRERATGALRAAAGSRPHVEQAVRLQGTADWNGVWKQLVRAANDLDLHAIVLDVNAPIWHESFHGRWDRRGGASDELAVWRLDLPVFSRGNVIGRLVVAGERSDESIADQLVRLADLLAKAEAGAAELGPPLPRMPDRPAPEPAPAVAS